MAWRSNSRLSPIGLDLGAHSFKAVQLRRSGKGPQVLAALSLPRTTPGTPPGAAEIERLQGVLDRRGFIGRDVILAVPAASYLSAILELPARAPGVPLEQIAAAEFSRVNKLEPAALSMSTWELPPSARASRATYMMAAGASVEHLNAHVDLVESGGLNVVAIEEPYSAAARGALHGTEAGAGLMAVVDLGWDAARLSILHGQTVAYTRKLGDAGMSKVVSLAVDALGGDANELQQDLWRVGLNGAADTDADLHDLLSGHLAGVLREIGLAFGYADHQYPDSPMKALLLCGGGAALPGIESRFSETLGVPARIAGDGAAPPASITALGLALWEDAT
ncbi:MAG: hypothetical protein JWM57_1917 [Phycisphaerales bacterium]|nr:hypothetical protein [Phycisphaerales bacterium]